MALMTGDQIVDSLLAKTRARGVEYSDDFMRLLAKPIAEINEFERIMRMPFRGGSVTVEAVTDTLEASGGAKTLTYGEKGAELAMRAERLAQLGQGLKAFARGAAGGFVLGELAVMVATLISQLWRFNNPSPIDPDKYRRAGCGGSLKQVGGIWRQDFADAFFDLLDAYEQEVKQTWEGLRDKVLVPGVVMQFWIDLQADYYASVFHFTGTLRNSIQASRFGPGNVRQTRNGVHPR